MEAVQQLARLRTRFNSGVTQPYTFRRQQLQALRTAVRQHEEDLMQALYADLKKNREESWVTEIGFVLAEIRHTLRHLRQWMRPQRVPTNLLNFGSRSFVYKEPLGVVLIIGPWNYPLQLLFTPLIGAVAAGNCAVLKPSEYAPATAAVMKKIIEEVFRSDYILYVEGDGAEVVPGLMNNFRFDHVFYTGSTAVGKSIYKMAAEGLVPVTLELGGKSPCVVESDANIGVAARRIAVTKFSNAGQMCVAPDYVLVHRSVKEELMKELIAAIKKFFSDDPSTDYNYGKIINPKAFNRLAQYVEGGTVVFGGTMKAASQYIGPTLLDGVSPDAPIMNEEIFGPLLPVMAFDSVGEAKAVINKNADPLAFYVFTSSKEKAENWIREVPAGGGCVNNASWHFTNFHLPFGGRGASGIGRYHGRHSFNVFSHAKAVMKTPTWFDPAIKYPPFKGKLKLFKRIIR